MCQKHVRYNVHCLDAAVARPTATLVEMPSNLLWCRRTGVLCLDRSTHCGAATKPAAITVRLGPRSYRVALFPGGNASWGHLLTNRHAFWYVLFVLLVILKHVIGDKDLVDQKCILVDLQRTCFVFKMKVLHNMPSSPADYKVKLYRIGVSGSGQLGHTTRYTV